MSLAATASLWTSDNPQAQTRKRQSTIRKTVKIRPYNDNLADMGHDDYTSTAENFQTLQNSLPPSMEDVTSSNAAKTDRVNEMLNKITTVNAENDGNKLADFQPINNPSITNNREPTKDANANYYRSRNLDPSELLPQTLKHMTPGNYLANEGATKDFSNYQKTYEESPKLFQNQPYYAKMGIGATGSPTDDKLIEKINYMIHILEENQVEKTANITEEFFLYLFLGVFVIFIVDTFSRSGKYVR
jgi:hypothetical protein